MLKAWQGERELMARVALQGDFVATDVAAGAILLAVYHVRMNREMLVKASS